jgi:hypothetical protein
MEALGSDPSLEHFLPDNPSDTGKRSNDGSDPLAHPTADLTPLGHAQLAAGHVKSRRSIWGIRENLEIRRVRFPLQRVCRLRAKPICWTTALSAVTVDRCGGSRARIGKNGGSPAKGGRHDDRRTSWLCVGFTKVAIQCYITPFVVD